MSANTLPTPAVAPMPPALPEVAANNTAQPVEVACLPFPSPNTEQRLVLSGISWQEYVAVADALPDRYLRMTYDRGTLEIMTVSFQHERLKHHLRRFLDVVTEELNISALGGGSTTFRREDVERGLEPDKCYWFQNLPRIQGRRQIDLSTDPPPDLAIEVQLSRNVLNRVRIYGALGVPEVWRFDGQALRVLLRGEDGAYREGPRSRALPFLPVGELLRFADLGDSIDDTALIRTFRQWVREQVAANWGQPPSVSP